MQSNGTIYVADTGNNRIQVFHNDTFARSIGSPGSGPGELLKPTGIHVHREGGMIYVADTGNDRVQVFHPNGTFARSIGSPGSGPGEFSAPEDVHVQQRIIQYIAVADTGNDRVQFFHPNGTFAAAIGSSGSGPGQSRGSTQFDGPTSVYFHFGLDGIFHVVDTGNDRLQLLTWDSRVKPIIPRVWFEWILPDIGLSGPRSLAEGGYGDGRLVVADTGNHRIVQFRAAAGVIEAQFGSFGAGPGNFSSPKGVDMTWDGEFAVADTGNNRVQVFHDNRTLKFIIGTAGGNGTDARPPPTPPGNGTDARPPPTPVAYTCSVSLAAPDLDVSVRPGDYSQPVRQTVLNSGNLTFAGVDLSATPWRAVGGAPAAAVLPASATEVSTAGAGGPYAPLANGTAAVASDLSPGAEASLWFRLNLAPYASMQGGNAIVQHVTYGAECGMPP